MISGVVEIPAYTFLIFTLDRWGRKKILCGCMMISGTALLATIFFPPGMKLLCTFFYYFLSLLFSILFIFYCFSYSFVQGHWGIVTLAMVGKLAITSSYGAIYIFTAEQFPTVVRNVGLGASSTFARVGGVIAPSVNYLVSNNSTSTLVFIEFIKNCFHSNE